MFNCEEPIWSEDDISECFKRDYLLTLFPLAACLISFLVYAWQIAATALSTRAKDGYVPIRERAGSSNGSAQLEIHNQAKEEVDIHENEVIIEDVDKPRGEVAVVIIELLILLAQVAVHVAIYVTHSYPKISRNAQFARIATWAYILLVAMVRLVSSIRRRALTPQLWYHTAWLYILQWFFTVWIFRGDLAHHVRPTQVALSSTDFALSTLLMVIVLSVRRGNHTVTLVHNEKLPPSPETVASLFSIASFSWVDSIILLGYKRTLEISDVWDLPPTSKARKLVNDFRTLSRATRLAYRLLRFFKWDLCYQFLWTALGAIVQFAPTLILKAILEYVQDPDSISVNMAWLYVILIPLFGFVDGVASGLALWKGREICIKLRAILVSEIYAKTLRRKTAINDEKETKEAGQPAETISQSKSWKDKFIGLFRRSGSADMQKPKHVSSGTIINLMSVDAFKVSEICAYLHFLIPMAPIELAIAVGLLYRVLGWSAVAAIVVMVLLVPINMWFTGQFQKAQKKILAATDARIHMTNEVLNNVRIVKFFAWEEKYMNEVNGKRYDELAAMRYRFGVWTFASSFWSATPIIITGVTFFLYTVVEGRPLVPSVAFTALSLFSLLRYPLDRLTDLIARVLEAKVSIDRVDNFLQEEETGKYDQLAPTPRDMDASEIFIGFKNATCSWGAKDEDQEAGTSAFRMINIDIQFVSGCLNIIAGPTGSGKTSLLMALLGEMTMIQGSVHLPGGYVREKLAPSADGLTESVAYCAQQAWLVNDTIKQNIIFASAYDQQRYEAVIDACALRKDLEILEAGDATLVGEKGIVVSGGQKQRISLARALYCNARYVLLDDCLSAVDSHTAQHIFDHCINGPMMKKRTCILVTHNLALTVPNAKFVVMLDNGKIKAQGLPEKLKAQGIFGDALDSSPATAVNTRPNTRPASRQGDHEGPAETTNGVVDTNGHTNGNKSNSQVAQPEDDKKGNAFQADVEDANKRVEAKSEGAVAWGVIKLYFSSMGSLWFPIGIIGGYIASNLGNIATNVWIRQWANSYQYSDRGHMNLHTLQVQSLGYTSSGLDVTTGSNAASNGFVLSRIWAMLTGRFMWYLPTGSVGTQSNMNTVWGSQAKASRDPDVGYYLGIYGTLGVLYVVLVVVQNLFLFGGSLRASRALHGRLLESVMRAKFKFFDTTPLGQIMNRFSKDLQSIDLDIAAVAAGALQALVGCVTTVILITIVTPGFLIAAIFLAVLYVAVALFYVKSSRDLKRLESSNRSPLYQQFGETISGITTIRAYGDEQRFIRDNASRINTHNRPFIYLWATNRWLALRIQWAGALVAFSAAMFVLLSAGTIDAGAAGVSLSYALTFNDSILWLVRLYAENEQNMNHVERVKQYLDVEQEAPARNPEEKPNDKWPSKGKVEFINYTTRYRSDLDPVLKNVNVKFEGEEKVGIVGRTGAGKSSLAMALFRCLEADTGKILVDDVDIGKIGLQDLREAITIVPQDPTLFTGTIRNNLDPFGLYTDEQIFDALRRVHLIGSASRPATPAPPALEAVTSQPGNTTSPKQTPYLHLVDDPSTIQSDHSAMIGEVPPAVIQSSEVLEPTASIPSAPDADGNQSAHRVITNTRENSNIFQDLSSTVAESGTNLSQGQRQLLCLARALLKNPRVLLMDEATASIDYATDAKIQETLREVRGSTLITIAHRLKTIVDYDKVLVLDKGEVVEFGPPWELIEQEDGNFRGLCESSGELDTLLEAAGKAKSKSVVE